MKKLIKSAFNRAKVFLASEARKLEWHLFGFHFDERGGSKEKVVEELKRYQNLDGGFRRALEPDLLMEDSSVVATKFALQILIDIQAPAQERLVQDGIAYLLDNFDKEKGVWPLVTNKVMDAPHASWWDVEGLEEEFGSFLANPKASVLRCFLEYQELVPQDLIDSVSETLMEHFERLPVKMRLFDAMSFLLLLQANRLGDENRERLVSKFEKTGTAIVSSNPKEWQSFTVMPLWLAPSPSAPLADVLDEATQRNLDYELENQNSDGSW
jgi:hypothetical protein